MTRKSRRRATRTRLHLSMLRQPDNFTCGPTCLQAVYQFYNDDISLEQLIGEVSRLDDGGTLGVLLACHALRRGYDALIYTYNLQIFDPTWFDASRVDLSEKLRRQAESTTDERRRAASFGYVEFLALGGEVRFADLTPALIRRYVGQDQPILTGLSATYLHRTMREYGSEMAEDDVRGAPIGHFVVLCGYDRDARQVLVADPLYPPSHGGEPIYAAAIERVLNAILLGIVTYDANLLLIRPREGRGA